MGIVIYKQVATSSQGSLKSLIYWLLSDVFGRIESSEN